jgi:hypothetical protein
MAAEQRKLLEQLMGADALDPRRSKREEIDLYNPKICKAFLVDVCIHDLFTSTKQDLGPCPKLHVEKHKLEYIGQKNRGREFPQFEFEYERELERFLEDCNRRTQTANQRLQATPEDLLKMREASGELEELTKQLALATQEIELLGQRGEISRAVYEDAKLDDLRSQREAKQREIRLLNDTAGFSGHQKLQVCETCGAYLSRLDSDRRLADHFLGKMHMGYVKLREAYHDVKERNARRHPKEGESDKQWPSGGREYDRFSSRDRDRGYRDRDRDRDRYGDKGRDRDDKRRGGYRR